MVEGPPFDGVLGIRREHLDDQLVASAVGAQDETMVDSVLVGPANKPQRDDHTEDHSRVGTHVVWNVFSAPRRVPVAGRTAASSASALARERLADARIAAEVAHLVFA